ncbi:potassium channel family protein [Rhodopirellula sallentina]|uniref:potassium channel family protein n=1 Tax=Rhodopirellula sallentina TaxID=1263869 RepID=UPI001F174F39|nr:potassium channel family protein [Rhodopirellula sallentina]
MITTDAADIAEGTHRGRLVHLELLAMLVFLQISQSFLSPDDGLQRAVFNWMLLLVVFSAIRTFSRSRTRRYLALGAGVLGYALNSYSELGGSVWYLAAADVCFIIVFVLLLIALGESVFSSARNHLNRIFGAICIYIVMGLLFALVYSLLEIFQPGSFSLAVLPEDSAGHQETLSRLIYFSNVTLTTLGYGDIQPVSRPARNFATLEAMVGQLYLAIVVARLVGVHIATDTSNPKDDRS